MNYVSKPINVPVFIFNTILFLFQFETFGLDVFSVYRLLIFPLLCLSLLYIKVRIQKKDFIVLFLILGLFGIQLIIGVANGDYSYFITVLGQAILLLVSYSFLTLQGPNIANSTLLIFASYSIFHLGFLAMQIGEVNISHRFSGYHWDPNYMCGYVLIALWAKIYFAKFNYKLSLFVKILIYSLISLDVIMIMFSMSKGGFLALLLSVLLFCYIYHKRLFSILLVLSVVLGVYAFIRSYSLYWSTEMSLPDTLIYRFFTKSIENNDISTGRIDLLLNYIYALALNNDLFLGMNIYDYIEQYNFGKYPHNGILEFFITTGFIGGLVFSVIWLYKLVQLLFNSLKYRYLSFYSMITLTSFFIFLFLSFIGLKFFWFFMAALIVYSRNKRI